MVQAFGGGDVRVADGIVAGRRADGSFVNYANWETGQPNNSSQFGEDFVLLNGWSGQWDDVNLWVEKRFVLEIPCPGVSVGIVQTVGPASGSMLAAGVFPVTYVLTDSCGAVTTCQFSVTVQPGNGGGCAKVNHALNQPTACKKQIFQ